MDITLTYSSIAAIIGAMLVLAIIPDTSAIAVVARSISSGFIHGLVTIIGIVVGDFIFILLAVYGLSAIAETMGNQFVLVKYLGGAYLIWLGVSLWRSKSKSVEVEGIREISWWSNFLCGLFITLGDPKAILFYLSFLPAFVKLSKVTTFGVIIIMLAATITIGGAKLSYAYMADKVRAIFKSPSAKKGMNIAAGSIMIGIGITLVAKT